MICPNGWCDCDDTDPVAHTVDHNPTVDHDRCETCDALLRRAFNRLADRAFGPRDADELMTAIREELE